MISLYSNVSSDIRKNVPTAARDCLERTRLPVPVTAGEQLKRERWLLGLTSQEMAVRLGIDQGTLLRREATP